MIARVLTILLLSLLAVPLAAAQEEEIVEYLPAPTGPYQVGSSYRHWVDESRDETLTEAPDDKRELLVRFWYPATVAEDAEPLPALPFAAEQIPVIESAFRAANFLDRPLPVEELAVLPSQSFLNAPLIDAGASFPVLLFSHGWLGTPDLHNIQFEELASHGYVVVAVNHPYTAAATVYPDGRVAEFSDVVSPEDMVPVAVDDMLFVLDQVTALNDRDPEGMFTGRLDFERLGVFGMSFGGIVATSLCVQDERCKALVNEDGYLFGTNQNVTLSQPVMFMYSSQNRGMNGLAYQRADSTAYGLTFKDFGHSNFTDLPLWPSLVSGEMLLGRADALASVLAVNAYLLAFFDTYLKGEPSPLLDGPSDDFPDVDFRSRNTE